MFMMPIALLNIKKVIILIKSFQYFLQTSLEIINFNFFACTNRICSEVTHYLFFSIGNALLYQI